MLKGKFKTAYLQREIPLDAAVAGDGDFKVGQLVTLVSANAGKPQYFKAADTLAAATHIIAQSDMTMEYGHVPVENRDYRYSDVVARTNTAGVPTTVSTVAATTEVKKVAVFKITNSDDVIAYNV